MLENSLMTRGVAFAFLFGPPRFIRREEAAVVHGAVCDRLRYDDISFHYSSLAPTAKPTSQGFSIRFERKEGRGGFQLSVDYAGALEPMRLLISYDWPPALESVTDLFDLASAALFESLKGDWQRVVAEVRLRAQCEDRDKNGLQFFRTRVLGVSPDKLAQLGAPLVFGSVRLEVGSTVSAEDSLHGPKRDVLIEVLREDPRSLYLEVVSQWSQLPVSPLPGAAIDLTRIRPIDKEPRDYVRETYEFLRQNVMAVGAY